MIRDHDGFCSRSAIILGKLDVLASLSDEMLDELFFEKLVRLTLGFEQGLDSDIVMLPLGKLVD
jgi:hypothetical protein